MGNSPTLSPGLSGLPTVFALVGIVYYAILGGLLDELLLLGALVFQSKDRLLTFWTNISVGGSLSTITVLLVAATSGIFGAAAVGLARHQRRTQPRSLSSSASFARSIGPARPLLFPCITTHARLFPKKHSFTYSYLVVGVPVGWSGVAGGMVSTDPPTGQIASSIKNKGWFHIDANDYLERGSGHLGLRGKLDAYLDSQGIDASKYPYAYLVTAARFLGYHFNPVSFWYLYNANRTLSAMILEVNNTFGERRMYFLTPESHTDEKESQDGSDGISEGTSATAVFSQTWPKDFHVSPFNSRKGSYALRASDPLAPGMKGVGPIQATIILRSSHEHGKIVARLFSAPVDNKQEISNSVAAFDPARMSAWQKCRFLADWWWVGLVTFPRIVKQAGVLFFQRRLHVWFRPEPLKKSLGRLADATERRLEVAFRQYLRHLVEASTNITTPLVVKYIPCGIPDANPELIRSPTAEKTDQVMQGAGGEREEGEREEGEREEGEREEGVIEFRVLTPAFYARFVHYAHDVEAFFCELRESATISVSRPELFTKLVLTKAPRPTLQVTSAVDYAFFKAIQKLRRRPERIERPMTWPTNVYAPPSSLSSNTTATSSTGDLRGFRLSAMDGFVLGHIDCHQDLRKSYRAAVLTLFLADRVAFGAVPVFQAYCLIFRAWAAWFVARGILGTVLPRGGAAS